MSHQNLVSRFREADLPLEVARAPLRGAVRAFSATDQSHLIFQMDIQRGKRPGAGMFRIWPGAEDNRIHVLDPNREEKQLILFVHEPSRTFVQDVPRIGSERTPTLGRRDRLVGKTERKFFIERRAPDTKRHYLTGMDEVDYFIAELPAGVSSVKEAHHVLKPQIVHDLQQGRKVLRQGEYFLVEASPQMVLDLQDALQHNRAFLHTKAAIGNFFGTRQGNPHIASELIRFKSGDVYVRGEVRHRDHNTLHLPGWFRVHKNTEANVQTGIRQSGNLWID